MTKSNNRRVAAHRLRRKAERYRTLAHTNGDERDVAMMEAKAVKHDEEASRFERAIGGEQSS